MKSFFVRPASVLRGAITLAGDKSIAHRAVILSSLSAKRVRIENFPTNKDCLFTLKTLQKLGIRIRKKSSFLEVSGSGLYGFRKPKGPVFVGDSGTTLRLILGVLAGQHFTTRLIAGKSLSGRPMRRVSEPLRLMGAKISAKRKVQNAKLEEYPPITINGGNLRAITYKMPVASAQVKSALLLAGLYASGKTKIIEPIATRDHTERMLKVFQADLKVKQNTIVITGNPQLIPPQKIYLPGDISSASFFLVLAAILPDARITIKKVSLNPSRIGIIKVLKRMGANIQLSVASSQFSVGEPLGDVIIKSSLLKATVVKKTEVPSLIDELPILMVAACFARGKTVLEGVGELRVKETDRIRSMAENLRKMGARIEVCSKGGQEGIIISGPCRLRGAQVESFGDHRTAMSMAVAGLAADGVTEIDEVACIQKSFPNFLRILKRLVR